MKDLIKTVVILGGWTAILKGAEVWVMYAPSQGHSDTIITGVVMIAGAWAAAMTYLIISTEYGE